MVICKTAAILENTLKKYYTNNINIGFVPTMGALHNGHIALIEESKQQCAITVASIFVNPTQFNDKNDFEKYPITIENDIFLLEKAGCDIIFLPSVNEIYSDGIDNLKHYELSYLEEILEGKYRKGHFQGVCNVVERLLLMVKPTILFLGQKDYQQCMVVSKLVELMNWQNKLKLVMVPTIREENGLAMSSRNRRLTEEERTKAAAIYNNLLYMKNNFERLPFNGLIKRAEEELLKNGFLKIDYISICNAQNLQPIAEYKEGVKLVVLIAAFIGEVRLIDNLLL